MLWGTYDYRFLFITYNLTHLILLKKDERKKSVYLERREVHDKHIYGHISLTCTKYMVMSREQTAGLSHTMKVDNSSIERVEQFKYLGTTLTNQNSIQEEIKSRLKFGNACYHSVQNLLSPVCYSKI